MSRLIYRGPRQLGLFSTEPTGIQNDQPGSPPANVLNPAPARPPVPPPGLPSKPPPARLPKNKLRLALLIGVGVLLLAAAYYGWRVWLAADDAQKEGITAVVTTGDLEDTITATGTLQPKEFVNVGTQVSG